MSIRDKALLIPAAVALALGAGASFAQTENPPPRSTQNQSESATTAQSDRNDSSSNRSTANQSDQSQSGNARSAQSTQSNDAGARTGSASDRAGTTSSDRMALATTPAVVTLLVLPMTSGDTTAQASGQAGGQGSSNSSNASQEATKSGCWARLYEDNNYKGDSFTLVGPIDMSNMKGPFGVDWGDVDSIQAGPKATITIYDNTNFRDRAAQIREGQNVPELSDKLGFFENVNSIRITCPGSRTG